MRTFLKAIAAVTISLSFYLSAFSQQVAKTIPYSGSPEGLIGFLQFTPKDYGSQKHPLIIFLHGVGERGNGTSQINNVKANAIPKFCAAGASMSFTVGGVTSSFVVLSPQLSTQYGYWPTYYVEQMVKYAKANLQIDPNRIYITGLSLGGGGTWRSITETGVQNLDFSFDAGIAAAAPVCGTQEMNDGYFCRTVGNNHLPIWAFHSMDDGTVGVSATQHGQMDATNCGVTPTAKFTYYQTGGHGGAWLHAFDTGHITVPVVVNGVVSNFTASPNLYEWFLSHTRSTTQTSTAPVAYAGAAQIITLPLSIITLTGTGTGTNGASIVSYSWAKTSGPAGGVISLPLLNTSLVTGLVQGVYVFTLTVKDNHGLTNSSSVTITVNGLLGTAPAASAGSAQTITLPATTANLSGTGTGTNGATISAYAWTKTSGPSGGNISSPASASTAVTGLVQGTYVFSLKVTDNHGLTGSASVSITVNAAAAIVAPSANAGSAQTITLPKNTINLSGTGTAKNGASIMSYAWVKTSGPTAGTISSPTLAATPVTGLVQGTYVFTITVKDNHALTASASVSVMVNAAPSSSPSAPTGSTPIGYVKQSVGITQACADASSNGRIAIYANSITDGSIVYLDAAHKTVYNGGYNWFSYTAALGGTVSKAFAIYANGSIQQLNNCSGTTTSTPVGNPGSGSLLGYIKVSTGPYQACSDASSAGRIPVYGKAGIANGSLLYTDAAMTKVYNGGFNWYSFTPLLGGSTTYAFAIYPVGSILLLRNCVNGGAARVADGSTATTTAEEDIATLGRIRDSAAAAEMFVVKENKLSMYPNPVHTNATIELYSADNGVKNINIYNSNGVLTAKYAWQTVQGNNTFSLSNVSGLSNGLYIIDIRDNNGKSLGSLKFIKM